MVREKHLTKSSHKFTFAYFRKLWFNTCKYPSCDWSYVTGNLQDATSACEAHMAKFNK